MLLMGCGNDDGSNLTPYDTTIQAFLSQNNIAATRTSSGLYYRSVSIDTATQSTISNGQVVSVYYDLLDLEGNVIASHQRADGDSLQFKVGANAVYPVGLNEAALLMTEGDTYSFIIPPPIGYETTGSAIIADESIVQIDLTIVDVQQEDSVNLNEIERIQTYITDNDLNNTTANPVDPVEYNEATGLFYKRTLAGTGNLPTTGDLINMDYTASYLATNDVIETQSNFTFTFGSSQPRPVLTGIELGIAEMQEGETALILLPSSIAYRESALVIPASISSDLAAIGIIPDYVTRIRPYSPLIFALTRND